MRISDVVIFRRDRNIYLIILLFSFAIYFLHFHHILLNLNNILSSITLDSIKNYYTFVYHSKHAENLLHFEGMNYPLGEHVVYTDCQPLLTFFLRCLPFTHEYLIGIMHFLLFASFIISPLILYIVLRKLELEKFLSFMSAIAISILSPQFLKINAGHHALAYGCMIPISILLLIRVLQEGKKTNYLLLFVFNTIIFLIHPYMGFSLSLFSFLSLLIHGLFERTAFKKAHFYVFTFLGGLLPIVLFKAFMFVSDTHEGRTTEPYGSEVMVENVDGLLSPVFGPFKNIMELFFKDRPQHFEGYSYLGFFTILLCATVLFLMPFVWKRIKINKNISSIFLASILILFISFGYHHKILNFFDLNISAVNQFRAVCRFAWVFYYTLPIFVLTIFYQYTKHLKFKNLRIVSVFSVLFFLSNLLEASAMFAYNEPAYWKFRNFFKPSLLNSQEKIVLLSIKNKKPQAILPLPIFHGGSEMYDRMGSSTSMIPSFLYSFHSGIPILSVMMSRTSVVEAENLIQTLNSYKTDKKLFLNFTENDFFVIKTNDHLLPDEERLEKTLTYFEKTDSLGFAYISKYKLEEKKFSNDLREISFKEHLSIKADSVIFIPTANRKPFLLANMDDYENILSLDSSAIDAGEYVLSFHYHYLEKTFQSISLDIIMTEKTSEKFEWISNTPVRLLSGFYNGYAVFEKNIYLNKNANYEFLLKGLEGREYHITNFMIRPKQTDILYRTSNNDTVYNNFYSK